MIRDCLKSLVKDKRGPGQLWRVFLIPYGRTEFSGLFVIMAAIRVSLCNAVEWEIVLGLRIFVLEYSTG